ncbi:transcriptional regulator, GntR family [Paracoccus halophilus]|uniref:Pyruvate dehydrogenase complex repressor n=1 Tax=Paracoccus halophilus TaxID=376733 RepID=A0A099EXR5_9RHOB|nr:FCD domain-containing protein [Paracoccus halophilus]KGJ03230.1 GntR family transcriptional regulator [Paracoccus halophilus]SFA52809.1 transcriptional regulator, GntR family [Paracoccus halophilus]
MTETSAKPGRAAETVARHIEKLILEGALRPEEYLLAERELASRLNVSRPTLRDALKLLEERGLILAERGRGTRVAALGAAAISDPLIALLAQSPEVDDDYLEFRDVVESQAAALAATRANEIDRRMIAGCLAAIEAAHAKADAAEEAEADAALHLAIYEASHNLVLLQIMRALSGILRSDVIQNRGRMFTIPAIRELLRDQHRAIAEAILARDPQAARDAAHEHLSYIRRASREIRESEAKLGQSLRRVSGGGLQAPRGS